MQKLIITILTLTLVISGCDFVKRVNPFAKKVDTMEIYQQRQDSIRRAELLRRQQEEARREQARADSISKAREAEEELMKSVGRYHLIVGAFKTPAYAEDFHREMLARGNDSRIIMSANNFHLVTIKSLENYNTAVREWREIRSQGEHLVWLYIKDI